MSYKYVMFELDVSESGIKQRIPVIFPSQITHADLADTLRSLLDRGEQRVSVHSAGFVNLTCSDVYGKSETLDLKVDEQDREIINSFPYFSGFV